MKCPACNKKFLKWCNLAHHVDDHLRGTDVWAKGWACFCGLTYPFQLGNKNSVDGGRQSLANHLEKICHEEGLEAHMVLSVLSR